MSNGAQTGQAASQAAMGAGLALSAVFPVAGAILAGLGAVGSGVLGAKQGKGSDDLKKLQKRMLQPDPLEEVAKAQEFALREAMLMQALTDMIEQRALRKDRLRLAGFEPQFTRVPLFEGPSVIRRGEKGPDKFIPVPGGPAYIPESRLTPEILQNLDLLGPLLVAFRNPIIHTRAGRPLDRELTKGLTSGAIRPGQAQSPEWVARNVGIPVSVRRKGPDFRTFIPTAGLALRNVPEGGFRFGSGDPRGQQVMQMFRTGASPAQIASFLGLL